MNEFLFWKYDGTRVLVNHSRYWSSFDDLYSQKLLSSLLASNRYFAQIITSECEKVYEQFMLYLSKGEASVSYDQEQVKYSFAQLDKSRFEEWLKTIKGEEIPEDSVSQSESKLNSDVVEDKASWFSWFRIVPRVSAPQGVTSP